MDSLVSIAWWRSIFTRYGQGCAFLMLITLVIGFGWNQFGSRNQQGAATNAAAQETVLMTVNGEPVTQAQFQAIASRTNAPAGLPFAQAQGEALKSLVNIALIQQIAKERNVHPLDVDVDRAMAAERQNAEQQGAIPKGASDSDWQNYVEQRHGMTLAEYRDAVAREPQALVSALLEDVKSKLQVSDADVKNQLAQTRLNTVLIPSVGGPSGITPPGGIKPLPDALARKKAEDLLAKAKAGADIAALAKANSADFNAKKGGDTGLLPEYKGGQMASLGNFLMGKAFDDAVHKTEVGKFTDVVAVSGFQHGYAFAKVAERKFDTPKDYNPKKALEDYKSDQAKQQLSDLLKAKYKAAVVVVRDNDKKVFYDNAKLEEMRQQVSMSGISGDTGPVPTKESLDQQQSHVTGEWEDMLKRHPEDATAASMVAANLEATAKGKPDAATADRLITLYTTILKTNEDQALRFKLADLYKTTQKNDLAYEQFQKIAKLMSYNPPFDAATMRTTQSTHQQLAAGYRAIGKTEDATKEEAAAAALEPKIKQATAQEAAQQKAAQGASMPPISLAPGQSAAAGTTVPVPPPPKTAPAKK